jgi:hypothetical protein
MTFARCRGLLAKGLLFWLHILQCRAGKWLSRAPDNVPPIDLLRRQFAQCNRDVQEEFHLVFAPYHRFCSQCLRNCCLGYYPPEIAYRSNFFPVDALIYGGTPEQLTRLYEWDWGNLFRTTIDVLRGKKAFQTEPWKEDNNIKPCPDLGENGCKLSWGNRSVYCILFLCDGILNQMTPRDYHRYLKVSFLYLWRITKFINKLTAAAHLADGSEKVA